MATLPALSHPTSSHLIHSSLPKTNHSTALTNKASAIGNGRSSLEAAMQSLSHYSPEGKTPEEHRSFYNSLISVCISEKALHEGNYLRSHISRIGYKADVFFENQFINLYSKCGEIDAAREVFDSMSEKNVVSWNAMLAGYCSNDQFLDALSLFCTMIERGPSANQPTYLAALRASIGSSILEHGKQIHTHLLKKDLMSLVELGNAIISMYSKFGNVDDAQAVFETMIERDEVSWNSIIAANAQNGHGHQALKMFIEMMEQGLAPNDFTFGSLLGSTDISIVEEIHSQMTKRRLWNNVITGSALLDAYARCRKHQEAHQVFQLLPKKNTVTWNSIISAYLDSNMVDKGLEIFSELRKSSELPDEYTISTLLKAAAMQLSIAKGYQIHALAVKMGLHLNALIGNCIITMYGKHEDVNGSWQAFKNIVEPDLISWNSMIQSYLDNKEYEQAMLFFIQMKNSGLEPDEFSFAGALAACSSLTLERIGRALHCNTIKVGMEPDAFVGSVLIDMYSKFLGVSDSKKVFDEIKNKDLVAWNTIISSFSQNGYLEEVLEILCLMREENLEPDDFTFASILTACANSTATDRGRQIHTLIIKSKAKLDAAVANALITMYSRGGCINEAETVFSKHATRNMISWTVMMAGYVQSGHPSEALELFQQMQNSGVEPNGKTFITLLTACSYAGMNKKAEKYFEMMGTKYGIQPTVDHYACMVDILARAGRLSEAEEFTEQMPYEADALIWRMLLSACRNHGDVERGKRAMERILAIEPQDSAAYVLLSNLYASKGIWTGVEEIRQLMRENGVRKEPGKSWIQACSRVHEFVAGDHSHPQTDEIYSVLSELLKQMKAEYYVPVIEHLLA